MSAFAMVTDSSAPGAYALIIEIPTPFRPSISTLTDVTLAPGRYLYAGSAFGPGGIGARVKRHLRKEKSQHWHVDRLTNAFGVSRVLTFEGVKECALVRSVLVWPGTKIPIKGFGSSDCKTCPAHLVSLAKEVDMTKILELGLFSDLS